MSVATLRAKVEKRSPRRVPAVRGATARGAAYAKAQVTDLATQGQRLARSVDGQIKQVTGRRSTAWIDDTAALVGNNLWTILGLAALTFCAFFLLV